MAGHAQLKFVMTECSKTQIRLTRLIRKDKICSNFLFSARRTVPVCVRIDLYTVCERSGNGLRLAQLAELSFDFSKMRV